MTTEIGNLKQALNDGLVLKRVNRVIKFDQEALLKSYIMKKKEKKNKSWFWKRF